MQQTLRALAHRTNLKLVATRRGQGQDAVTDDVLTDVSSYTQGPGSDHRTCVSITLLAPAAAYERIRVCLLKRKDS